MVHHLVAVRGRRDGGNDLKRQHRVRHLPEKVLELVLLEANFGGVRHIGIHHAWNGRPSLGEPFWNRLLYVHETRLDETLLLFYDFGLHRFARVRARYERHASVAEASESVAAIDGLLDFQCHCHVLPFRYPSWGARIFFSVAQRYQIQAQRASLLRKSDKKPNAPGRQMPEASVTESVAADSLSTRPGRPWRRQP